MKKEPKWLIKERKDILNMSNKELLENTLSMADTVGGDMFYEAQYDNSKEVDKNHIILNVLLEELEKRLEYWLRDGKNPAWERGL